MPIIPQGIIKRAEHPAYGYYLPTDEYFESIIRWHKERNNVSGLERKNIGYENGVLGCVSTAIKAFSTPGEKILLHSPTYIGFTHVLENTGRVAELSKQVLSFKLSVKIFDVFGEKLDGGFTQNLYTASESDLDRQLCNADAKLGGFGFPNKYGKIYADL